MSQLGDWDWERVRRSPFLVRFKTPAEPRKTMEWRRTVVYLGPKI